MNVFFEKYILISGFLAFSEVNALGKVLRDRSLFIGEGGGLGEKFQKTPFFYQDPPQ